MLLGYARVSTRGQDPAYQVAALERRGCEKIYVERVSAREERRPELTALLDYIRPGDTLVVWKFDRLARSVTHLLSLASQLDGRGCQLLSITEGIDTTTPGGRLVFAVFAALAEFEADLIRERTAESFQAAKAAGRKWGRPSAFHDPENVRAAAAMLTDPTIPKREIARRFKVSTTTLYRWFPGGRPSSYTGTQRR